MSDGLALCNIITVFQPYHKRHVRQDWQHELHDDRKAIKSCSLHAATFLYKKECLARKVMSRGMKQNTVATLPGNQLKHMQTQKNAFIRNAEVTISLKCQFQQIMWAEAQTIAVVEQCSDCVHVRQQVPSTSFVCRSLLNSSVTADKISEICDSISLTWVVSTSSCDC